MGPWRTAIVEASDGQNVRAGSNMLVIVIMSVAFSGQGMTNLGDIHRPGLEK